jgi:hypothetical protein
MGRTYPYLTRGDDEQTNFLVAVVRLFYHVMAGQPLSVVGFQVPDNNPRMIIDSATQTTY